MAPERLQKILARAGISSRRSAEELIEQGRVMVNGKKVTLGMSADAATDDIRLDGERILMPTSFNYFLLNKPKGVISDEDVAKEHQSARDLIPVEGHLYPVGRLDLSSEGLMLFTNDGALAHRLTHPRYDHPKTYEVVVDANPNEDTLDQWRQGIVLEGVKTRPAQVTKVKKTRQGTVLEVTLREGRKRQIRKVAARLGMPVISLIRVKLGPLELGDLPSGAWRRLTPEEVNALHTLRDVPEPKKPRGAARSQGARTGTRRPMPKGTGDDRRGASRPSRFTEDSRGDRPARGGTAAGGRSEERATRSGSDKPAGRATRAGEEGREQRPTRRWPSEERRGSARTEAAQKLEGGQTRRPARSEDDQRDERPARGGTSRPPRAGGERRDDRPARGGTDRPSSRTSARSGEDRPARGGAGKPAGNASRFGDEKHDDRPARGGTARPSSRSSSRSGEDRPARGGARKPAGSTSRFGDEKRDDRPTRRPSSAGQGARRSDDKPVREGDDRPTGSGNRPARPSGSRPSGGAGRSGGSTRTGGSGRSGGGSGRSGGAGRSGGTGGSSRSSGTGRSGGTGGSSRPSQGGAGKTRRPRKSDDAE